MTTIGAFFFNYFLMRQIQLTRGQVALVDDDTFEWLNQWSWYAKKVPNSEIHYAARTFRKNGMKREISMHRLILDITDNKIFGEHKDGDGLNNQRHNLRIATQAQNNMNRKAHRDSASKFLGVSLVDRKYWRTQLCKDGVFVYRKCFKTEIEAAKAYDNVAIIHFGHFARLNFPESNSLTPQTQTI